MTGATKNMNARNMEAISELEPFRKIPSQSLKKAE